VFIDIEASGLGGKTYPIEVGWATCDLASTCYLVRPAKLWDDWLWMPESEKIHNIHRDVCVREGHDVVEVAHAVNAAMKDRLVFSDAVDFDGYWLSVLFRAADVAPGFALYNANVLLRDLIEAPQPQANLYAKLAYSKASETYPHTHRADEDCLGWAGAVRLIMKESLPPLASRIVC